MVDMTVNIVRIERRTVYGVWCDANDQTVSANIKSLAEKYAAAVALPKESVWPYVVLSRNYHEQSGDFEMLIGGPVEKDGLNAFELPEGEYAVMRIKPKWGFLWGASIGEGKRFFYKKWLPQREYRALNMEYEYHTGKSIGWHPSVELVFAIERKAP